MAIFQYQNFVPIQNETEMSGAASAPMTLAMNKKNEGKLNPLQ